MRGNLQKWQRSIIRNNMDKYRQALENYYIKDKPLTVLENGHKAFSLLSPPLGSAAARRRIRLILNNIVDENTQVEKDGTVIWGARTPHFMTMTVTYRCQCNCQHCSAAVYAEEVNRTHTALSEDELKDAIRQTVDLGTTCVIFTGGEPLLYEPIYDLIATVDKSKSIATLFTNGEHLNEAALKKLKAAGLFGIFVSLDHSHKDRHDENRKRPGLYEKALGGIRLCQSFGILPGISTFVTKEKIVSGELDAMMELGKEAGAVEVFLFDVIATGKLDGQNEQMLCDTEIDHIREFRKKYNTRPQYPRIIHQTMFTSIAYPCAAEGCPAGVAQMHLRGNGDITPCDFTPLSFGNIRTESLSGIWQRMTHSKMYAQSAKKCRLSDPAMWDKIHAAQAANQVSFSG